MTRPSAIIGDIHGDAQRLLALVQEIEGRQLIFVGDYVNRGPESRKTLDLLLQIREHDRETIFLKGNHDAALLAYLDGVMPFYEFAGLGGIATIRAYRSGLHGDVRSEFAEVFPENHRSFLANCDNYFEASDLIVSHCGISPSNPESRRIEDMVLSRHDGLFSAEFKYPKLVVCGHYIQASGSPYVHGNFVCLDTGCGTIGGPLTALLMPERTIVQR